MAHIERETPRTRAGERPELRAIVADQTKQRASFHADVEHLKDFLVPHRFEVDERTKEGVQTSFLRRQGVGYGIALNRSWLGEIIGFIRRAPAAYVWGPLASDDEERTDEGPPMETVAGGLWADATMDGIEWRNLFEGEVLEWALSSPGGFLVADTPAAEDRVPDALRRPFLRFVPWSWVNDFGLDRFGRLRWIELLETNDERDPDDDRAEGEEYVLRYWLDEGVTRFQRFDLEGKPGAAGERELGEIVDQHGRPTLPVLPVRFMRHPRYRWAGAGLLRGLDDIVLDLYNQVVELREEERDIVFSLLAYTGPQAEDVLADLKSGTRFIHLGDATGSDLTAPALERISADGSALATMLDVIEMSLGAWALGAKRKAKEAVEVAGPRSGVSINAEFEVDLKPLLVVVAEWLDALETQAMFVLAQLDGTEARAAQDVGVRRDTNFRTRDEAERVAELVGTFRDSFGALPAEFLVRSFLRAVQAAQLIDAQGEAEDGRTIEDVLEEQMQALASGAQERAAQTDRFERGLFEPFAGAGVNGA